MVFTSFVEDLLTFRIAPPRGKEARALGSARRNYALGGARVRAARLRGLRDLPAAARPGPATHASLTLLKTCVPFLHCSVFWAFPG